MATRTITGTILRPNGKPWFGAKVGFALTTSTATMDATFPLDSVAITAADGTFSIDLEAGLSTDWRCTLPDGERFTFNLPVGATITLEVLRATYAPPSNPLVPTVIDVNQTASVTTTSAQLVPANARRGDTLVWNQGSATVYVAFGEAATTSSFPLPAGYNLIVTTTQAINARSASGTVAVYVLSEVHP